MKTTFIPGDEVPSTGVYRVHHDSHRLMHQSTLLAGKRFPRCKQCGAAVRFELARTVDDRFVIASRNHVILEDQKDRPRLVKAAGD